MLSSFDRVGGRSVAIACALVAGAVPTSAHFAERQSSISGYVASTELVVRGAVEGSDQKIEGGHSPRDGCGALRVDEVLKGQLPVPPAASPTVPSLTFKTTGVHQPTYRKGEQVLLFLNRVPDSDPPVFLTRQNAIERIELGGPDGPTLLSAVREYVAVDRVADAGERLRRSRALIVRDLASPAPILWQNALFDLSKRTDLALGPSDVAAIREVALQPDRESILRVGCVAKLGELGRAGSREAAQALASILASASEPIVRTMAAAALEETRAPVARPALARALDDPSAPVRRAAAECLGRLGEAEAVDPLGRVAGADPNAGVRFAALKAIARIGDERADMTLERLAVDPKFPDTAKAIDLARRQVAQQTKGKDKQ